MWEASAPRSWGLSSDELSCRGEALVEAFDTRSPQQAKPEGLAKPAIHGIHKLLAWTRKARTLQQIPAIVPIVLSTTAIALHPPVTVRDRRPSTTTPVQQVTAQRVARGVLQDEIKVVSERVTLAQIQELDELFALPGGPELVIHLEE